MTVKKYLQAMIDYIAVNDHRCIYLCKLAIVPLCEDPHYDFQYINMMNYVSYKDTRVAKKTKLLILKYRNLSVDFGAVSDALVYGESSVWWKYIGYDVRSVNANKIEFLKHLKTLVP